MDDALLKLLRSVDTPTVCNAIETAQGKRGFDRYTRGTVLASAPEHRAMVGYARTARIAARQASGDAPDIVRERRLGCTDTCRRARVLRLPSSRMSMFQTPSAPIGAGEYDRSQGAWP